MSPRAKKLLTRFLTVSLVTVCSVWLAGAAFLWTMQEDIIFHPQPVSPQNRAELEKFRAAEVLFDRGHGVILRGHCLTKPGRPLLVYYGGNAEEISWLLAELPNSSDCGVLLVNYRGYGDSTGKPTEQDLVADALTVLDETMQRNHLNPKDIILMGRSLGSGVAMQVAAQRKVAGLILITPYDSIAAVGQGMYPTLPVRLVLRHPFDSLAVASQIKVPVLILACREDMVIPLVRSETLAAALPVRPVMNVLEGCGHHDVHRHPRYPVLIREFVDKMSSPPSVATPGG